MIILECSGLVPADTRLLAGDELMVNGSMLAGETLPAGQDAAAIPAPDAALAERHKIVFRATAITEGGAAL